MTGNGTAHETAGRADGTVAGEVAPGWEPVRPAFEENFSVRGDLGAAVCVYRDGLPVVDLWGGTADTGSGRPYRHDTLQLIFSSTKGAVALCAALLAERGELDVDAPVAAYWPEFAAAGKAGIPVGWLLDHRAGLPAVDAHLALEDILTWDPIVGALADQAPLWEPGTAHGYHALTFGWLVGEVVRRVSGRSVGQYFRDEIARPLGLRFWIGLPEEEEDRVAPLTMSLDHLAGMDPAALERLAQQFAPGGLATRALFLEGAFGSLSPGDGPFNRRDVHAAEVPAANGITDARSLARMYAATIGEVDGVRLLDPATLARLTTVRSDGPDLVLGVDSRFGLGMMLDGEFSPFLGAGGFGHYGAGGSVGFAHPASGVAFGYVMDQMRVGLNGDDRTLALLDAVRSCLG